MASEEDTPSIQKQPGTHVAVQTKLDHGKGLEEAVVRIAGGAETGSQRAGVEKVENEAHQIEDVQVAGAPGPQESTASVSGLEVSVSELSLDNDDGFAADMTPNRPFGTSKCAVRGSINHDEYFFVDQIAKPGETKASKLHESRIGGKGANQAVAIARAGGLVQFYGTIGKDGVWIKEQLKEHGIDVSAILVAEKPTGRAIIQVGDDGENSIILFPGANHSELHEQQKFSSGRPWFGNATHLLLQNEIHPRSTLHALHEAANMVTIFNPSPMPPADQIREFPWTKIDWLLVNEGEAEALLRILGPPPPLNIRPASISAMSTKDIVFCLASHPSFASTNIICTLGPDGVLAFVPEFHRPGTKHEAPSFMHLPPAKLEGDFRDTTGAGDCFTGYFVQGLMEFGPDARPGHHITERDLAMLLRKCNLAAGMSVEKPGTIDSIPSRAAVESRLAASYAGSPIITGMKGPSGV